MNVIPANAPDFSMLSLLDEIPTDRWYGATRFLGRGDALDYRDINLAPDIIRINQISKLGSESMSTRESVQAYYKSLAQHDDRWQGMYSDDAVFADASHTLNAVGKPAVIQSFVPFLKTVKEVRLSRLIVEGERACAIVDYVYVNPKGETLGQSVAEVWQVRNDKLTELIIYFDLTAYRTFMRG